VREIGRQLQAHVGYSSPVLILQMFFVRFGGYLASWLVFCCLFGVICAAMCQIESGTAPHVSGSVDAIRNNLERFFRLSLLLFVLLGVVAMIAVGLVVGGGSYWISRRQFHPSGSTIRVVGYGLAGSVLLLLSRFGLAMPAVVLDDCRVGQAIFRSHELTEGKWLILASLLAKSLIGGSIVGMFPFWLAAFVPATTSLPAWFSSVLTAASIAAVAVVGPTMFIGFALLYLRMSAQLERDGRCLVAGSG
jgi:hypothetical protein